MMISNFWALRAVLSFVFVVSLFLEMSHAQAIIYVNANASSGGDGTTWLTAYDHLQIALTNSQAGDQIWVAAGVYKPGTEPTATFDLPDSVALFGGFSGNETLLSERNPDPNTNSTVLSGAICSISQPDDSYHVVTASNTGKTSRLDGFTITAGNASTFTSTTVNIGGGILCNGGGRATFQNLLLLGNLADLGGNVYISGSNAGPTFIDVEFRLGFSETGGGGVALIQTDTTRFIKCTFTSNAVNNSFIGSAMYILDAKTFIINSIFENHLEGAAIGFPAGSAAEAYIINSTFFGNNGDIISNNTGNIGLFNSIIIPATASNIQTVVDLDSSNNLINTTQIVFLADDPPSDYRLPRNSPAVNAGLNSVIPAFITTDLNFDPRITEGIVDIGATEFECPIINVWYVNAQASGSGNGLSWSEAYQTLQQAIDSASDCDTIYVAEGLYTPIGQAVSRENTFNLGRKGIVVLGGFPPIGAPGIADRDWNKYQTILSGDMDQDGDMTDNSYHVVTLTAASDANVLDGFYIRHGNANANTGPNILGGGIVINGNGAPILKNLQIDSCFATFGGGAYLNGSAASLDNIIFKNNTAGIAGGGLYFNQSNCNVTNCKYLNNTAMNRAGGLFVSGTFVFLNNVFAENRVILNPNGGAILNHTNGFSTFINATIVNNIANGNGGAIFVQHSGSITLHNSIIWNNTGPNQIINRPINEMSSNNLINVDPLFTETENSTFLPTACSPAVDSGENSVVSDLPIDISGNPRIFNERVDIGAVEVQGNTNIDEISDMDTIIYGLQSVTSSATIANLNTVTFRAPEFISMLPNFTIETGAVFTVEIGNCPTD